MVPVVPAVGLTAAAVMLTAADVVAFAVDALVVSSAAVVLTAAALVPVEIKVWDHFLFVPGRSASLEGAVLALVPCFPVEQQGLRGRKVRVGQLFFLSSSLVGNYAGSLHQVPDTI